MIEPGGRRSSGRFSAMASSFLGSLEMLLSYVCPLMSVSRGKNSLGLAQTKEGFTECAKEVLAPA